MLKYICLNIRIKMINLILIKGRYIIYNFLIIFLLNMCILCIVVLNPFPYLVVFMAEN